MFASQDLMLLTMQVSLSPPFDLILKDKCVSLFVGIVCIHIIILYFLMDKYLLANLYFLHLVFVLRKQ